MSFKLAGMLLTVGMAGLLMTGCQPSHGNSEQTILSSTQAGGETQVSAGETDTSGSGTDTPDGETDTIVGETNTSVSETDFSGETGVQTEETFSESEISAVFHLDTLENKGLGDFDNALVTEVIISPEGSSFVFWTTKTLTDFKLIGVEYNGDQFVEGKVYASYDQFTSECAVLITEMVPEGYPDLKVSFYDHNGQSQAFFISESGQDGSPILIEEETLLFGN